MVQKNTCKVIILVTFLTLFNRACQQKRKSRKRNMQILEIFVKIDNNSFKLIFYLYQACTYQVTLNIIYPVQRASL